MWEGWNTGRGAGRGLEEWNDGIVEERQQGIMNNTECNIVRI